MDHPLLEVKDLRTWFFTRWGVVKAVDGVSFTLGASETLGLVGESGCGKSMTALSILRLQPRPAGRIVGGQVLLQGEDLLQKSEREMRRIRGRQISMILQDPMQSLNPVFSVGAQIAEALRIHQGLEGPTLWEQAREMLRRVKIPSPELRLRAYPHQMSGGMRQRVVGAISLACRPAILIADEPTTSLDVTIQAQYLRLLKGLQEEMGLALIFITHDFGIVAKMCDRVAVMYAGRIVESAEVRELFNHPRHPYTVALLNSVPRLETKIERLSSIEGQPPLLYDLPPGCPFAPRCPHARDRCRDEYPPEVAVKDGHRVSCWMPAEGWDG
ncbi:MAG TPA: ABC transporter ATP-binding protein [Methylomirabilota bacterium]|jgi:oligopeptide/dipeptide ABC transporter ATP-binding protein|nr:ABC transporter ATP-binding protein [Methylomirabilota bacterium]